MVAPTKSLDDALDKIVELAKVPEDRRSHFRDLVHRAINGAVPGVKKLSDDSVASRFEAAMRNAYALLADLKTMEKGGRAGNALGIAGLSLRAAAAEPDTRFNIKHFINQLELLIKAGEAAAKDIARRSKRSVGRPSGTPGNLGFDFFVQQLVMDAHQGLGVKLKIYKNRDGLFSGSLLKTIRLLRAHLPDDFVPKTGLGRRLGRIVNGH